MAEDLIDPKTKKVIIKKGTLATKEDGQAAEKAQIKQVKIQKCYFLQKQTRNLSRLLRH
jgi:hypothetical protein